MKRILLLSVLFLVFGVSYSQTKDSLSAEEKARREKNIQAGNPFKKFGYKPKIATLSKGKYLEFHDLDSIVKIGSFSYHVKKKQITGYTRIDPNNSEAGLSPEVISRWMSPDPLSEEFPSWSPYNFTYNNPIIYNDPTGLAPESPLTDIWKLFKKEDGTYRAEKTHINDGKDDQIYLVMNDDGVATSMYQGLEAEYDMGKNGVKISERDNGTTTMSAVKDATVDFWTSDEYRTKLARETMVDYVTSVIPAEAMVVGMLAKSSKLLNLIPEGKLANHLFKGSGKLLDNPTNRSLIQKISNGKPLGIDSYGKS